MIPFNCYTGGVEKNNNLLFYIDSIKQVILMVRLSSWQCYLLLMLLRCDCWSRFAVDVAVVFEQNLDLQQDLDTGVEASLRKAKQVSESTTTTASAAITIIPAIVGRFVGSLCRQ